ncbi:MAG: hypothetical protein U0W65_14355 [Bacteroidia bacterium]
MNKLSLLLFYFIINIFFSNISYSQSITAYTGKILSFANYNKSTETATLIDTIIGQYRALSVDTSTRKIIVNWQIANDTITSEYFIEKIYTTNNNNSNDSKNLNLLSFDKDNFPLLVLSPLNNPNYLYLYYFWDERTNSFLKSEKIEVISYKITDYSNKK